MKDIVNGEGVFLSHVELKEKFQIQLNFLTALQLSQSVPLKWRSFLHKNIIMNTKVDNSELCYVFEWYKSILVTYQLYNLLLVVKRRTETGFKQ